MGKFILIVGPSGSGKSALLAYLKEQMPDVVFPVSCTTRQPRPGEVNGDKYYFISKDEFLDREQKGEFIEWAQFGGNYYGTLKAQITDALAAGKLVVREVEVQGARQLQQIYSPDMLKIIFIDAGSWEGLERRITARAPIDGPELLARRKRYEDELTFMPQAHIVVKNPDGGLEVAKRDFVSAVKELAK